jgi:hypothetical protein
MSESKNLFLEGEGFYDNRNQWAGSVYENGK